ncbi:DUF883 family protein [Cardiobacteriaceae bacterium TAE3-ERU3]|nr:DUF883 family protein [Cardiobacteriaceae bacterium TAE3-ERU3]
MSTEQRIEKLEAEFKELQGFAKEARSSIDKIAADLKDRAEEGYEDFKDSAEDAWDEAQSQGRALLSKTRRNAKKVYYNTLDYTQEHPWRVTSSALALIGVVGLVCYLVSERSNNQLDNLRRRYRDLF